jgi:hypothetical protein
MKKLFIAALIVLAAGSSAFAADVKLNSRIKANFEALFSGAQNITWDVTEQYVSAAFVLDDEEITAFFKTDGELIGTSQKVELKALPAKAIKRIKKEYSSYKITDSIEFTHDDEKAYYVMIEDGNKKQILEVSVLGSVSVFKGSVK